MSSATFLSILRSRRWAQGFSLTELMICVALITLLAGALGLALLRSQSRTAAARADLTQIQLKKNVLNNFTEELRWATLIQQLDSQHIRFVTPDPFAGGVLVVIEYVWDSDNLTLSRKYSDEDTVIVAEDVQVFNLDSDTLLRDATTYMQALTVTIQIGPVADSQLRQYIVLLNSPTL